MNAGIDMETETNLGISNLEILLILVTLKQEIVYILLRTMKALRQ